MRRLRRDEVARYAAPAAFLVAATIAILLVRAGLEHGGGTTVTIPSVTTRAASTPATTGRAETVAATTTTTATGRFYTVVSGDTFGSIAARERTTVQDLEALNPKVDPAALQPGQKIRVK